MTPDAIAFVQALLRTEARGSLPWIVAEQVWALANSPRADLLDYLMAVVTTNPPKSRAYEIAYEIWQFADDEDDEVAAA